GGVSHQEATRLLVREPGASQLDDLKHGQADLFGQHAERIAGDDAIADGQALDALAELRDPGHGLGPRREGQVGFELALALDDQRVGEVDSRHQNLESDLAGGRLGRRKPVGENERLGRTEPGAEQRLHDGLPGMRLRTIKGNLLGLSDSRAARAANGPDGPSFSARGWRVPTGSIPGDLHDAVRGYGLTGRSSDRDDPRTFRYHERMKFSGIARIKAPRFVHGFVDAVEADATRLAAQAEIDAAGCVRYSELLGFRYPVKAYHFKVSETLTRGSRLDEQGLKDLAGHGFKAVVNLCKEYDES